jgi:hypothetical protein
MSHPNFWDFSQVLSKSGENIFRPLFDKIMLDMNGLRRNHCIFNKISI